MVIEAWTDTENARDLLFYEVVDTIPQGFTADIWTTICGTDEMTGSKLNHVRVWFPEDLEAETIVYYNRYSAPSLI